MEIDDNLIIQWEPKVQKMASKTYINGLDRDDLVQELRVAIVKAAKGFEEDRGVLFHTYLHTAMTNTIRTLLSKAQRYPQTVSADETFPNLAGGAGDLPTQSAAGREALTDFSDFTDDIDFTDILNSIGLSEIEHTFINLRLEGLTMGEISDDLGESAYKIRQGVREKLIGGTANATTKERRINPKTQLDKQSPRV